METQIVSLIKKNVEASKEQMQHQKTYASTVIKNVEPSEERTELISVLHAGMMMLREIQPPHHLLSTQMLIWRRWKISSLKPHKIGTVSKT